MYIENNQGGWDIMEDDDSYFVPSDYCDLTDLYIDTVAAIMTFKDVLSEIDLQRLTETQQIQIFNLLNLDT